MRREPQQQLDEGSIISNLNLIDKVDRHIEDHQGDTLKHNLAKALNEYERAFDQTEGEDIFKHIFNAVEYAVNWDRRRDGSGLDKELSAVANVAVNKASIGEKKCTIA
jgi:hypothetical protein